MENQAITLEEPQVRELYPTPVRNMGPWTSTMEACLLPGPLGNAVVPVFDTLPDYIQQVLTFTPEKGGWAARAKFWETVLRPWLPPKLYHQAMQKFVGGYARNVRRKPMTRGRKLRLQGFKSELVCEGYRRGIAGEYPSMGSVEEVLEALSREISKPVEMLRANKVLCGLIELVNKAYEDGVKVRRPMLHGEVGKHNG